MCPATISSIRTAVLLLSGAVMLVAGVACNPQKDVGGPAASSEILAMLQMDFQEGFDDDTVLVRLNDKPIYENSGVTTDLRISRADAIEVPLEDGPMRLSISLPDRKMSGSIVVQGKSSIYVGVSVIGDSVEFIVSSEPFGYM